MQTQSPFKRHASQPKFQQQYSSANKNFIFDNDTETILIQASFPLEANKNLSMRNSMPRRKSSNPFSQPQHNMNSFGPNRLKSTQKQL